MSITFFVRGDCDHNKKDNDDDDEKEGIVVIT